MSIDNKKSFIIYTTTLVAILILLNLIGRDLFFRLDLTDNKMYSLSKSSKSVVSKIDDLMTLKVYFSNNLPGQYGNNRRYLQDILEEYKAYSNGKIHFEFFEPETNEDLQNDAQKSGIQPVQLQVIENDKVEVKRVYMGMVFIYEDKRETIPIIQTTTGLEYEITTNIKKLVDTNKKTIALVSKNSTEDKNENITQILEERYNVQKITLENPIPKDISVILLNPINDSLSIMEKQNLEEYVINDGNVLILQNRLNVDVQTQQATPINSNVFDLLDKWGLKIQENLVLDQLCGKVNVQQNMGIFRMAVPMDYPFLPIIQSFNKDDIIVNGLEQIRTMFPSQIILDTLVKAFPLFSSSNKSTTMTEFYNLNPDPKTNPIFNQLNENGKIIAARSEIDFNENSKNSQIILIADQYFISDDGGGSSPENHIFVLNAMDFLVGDSELIALRSREITSRPLQELEEDAKRRWKWINILFPSILIIFFGFLHIQNQKKRSKLLEELYD